MRPLHQVTLVAIVPILTVLYGTGDLLGWWDKLSGRQDVIVAWERFSSGEGFPTIWIYDHEPEFRALERMILRNTANPEVTALRRAGHKPSFMTIAGGAILETPVPAGWPTFRFVAPSTPILIAFVPGQAGSPSVPGGVGSGTGNIGVWGATVGDLPRWVEAERNAHRFMFTVVALSVLSIIAGMLPI